MEKDRIRLTCFQAHKETEKSCKKTACRMWVDLKENQNCTVIAAQAGPKTLQEIGEIFGVTRMRICQIEKIVLDKLSKTIDSQSI